MWEQLPHLIRAFSKAMYSTWIYYRPDHLLLDAGEGVATTLDNSVFGIQAVFLSHGHMDHLSGLPTLVHIRNAGMGDKTKPLKIYHPLGDTQVLALQDYIRRSSPRLEFELSWEPLEPGMRLPLRAGEHHGRDLLTFPTRHVPRRLTLGFVIVERRRRLKPEFQGRKEEELRHLAHTLGREAFTEVYEQPLLAYVGDSMPVEPAAVEGAELLFHEATFLEAKERERPAHATLEEALGVARDAKVKALILYHLSSRYHFHDVRRAVRQWAQRLGLTIPVGVLWYERLEKVWEGDPESAC